MTSNEAFIAEYQQTILDLSNRLARLASLVFSYQETNESLKKEIEQLKQVQVKNDG